MNGFSQFLGAVDRLTENLPEREHSDYGSEYVDGVVVASVNDKPFLSGEPAPRRVTIDQTRTERRYSANRHNELHYAIDDNASPAVEVLAFRTSNVLRRDESIGTSTESVWAILSGGLGDGAEVLRWTANGEHIVPLPDGCIIEDFVG